MIFPINKVVNSRYIVTKFISNGGFGEIYEANDTYLRKSVALKILKEDFSYSIEEKERFENEARYASMFSHPHIVSIYNFDYYQKIPFISYELMKGKTLKDYIDERGYLYPEESINIMLQILDGVKHIHSRDVIHNDLKPDNLFMFFDGTIKISDFGIASHLKDEMPDSLKVSVMYAAPEVLSKKMYSKQSDIYSLGIIFYEFLTGKTPFMKNNKDEEIEAHLIGNIPSIRYVNNINQVEKYDYVILKATERDLKRRYKDVDEMIIDLLKIKNNEPIDKPGLFRKLFKK